jgi:phage-related protein
LVILAIGALIAIIVIVIKNFDKIKEVLSTVAKAIGDFIGGAIEWLKQAFNAVWETVKAVAEGVVDAFIAAKDFIAGIFSAIADTITSVFTWIHNTISSAMEAIRDVILNVLSFIFDLWLSYLGLIFKVVETVFENVKKVITTVLDIVLGVVTTVLDKVRTVFTTVLKTIRDIVTSAFRLIRDVISGAMNFVSGLVSSALNGIKSTFESVWNGIVNFFGGAVSRLARVGGDIFGFIRESFKAALNFVIRGWNSLKFSIPSFGVGPVKFPGFSLGLPQIPLLANGAIVRGPMLAGIGEAGPEAVIPLSRPSRALQLMEQSGLADLARNSGGAAVNIQNATFVRGTDADLVAQKVLVAWRARSAA